ncbi:hypothetical protein BLNAU_25120 [Blattamonas nauphoetae]|uniref:Uncharacterized protein n=1 Tax=Blattamonas nauphoetae TaxID=2049346 RepID=A0ABQ9WPJ1_9EUKA|nr:hypothetical protein BLNAU_25120 [Blattamonas nauphoetae]
MTLPSISGLDSHPPLSLQDQCYLSLFLQHALLDDSSFTTTNPFFLVFTTFLNHHVSDNALNSSLLDFRAEMDKFAKARFLFTKTRALSLRPPILPIKLFTLNAYTYIAIETSLFFPNHTDLLKTRSLRRSLLSPEERAIALVAAVANSSKLETVDTHPDGCQARRRQALDDRDRADQIPSPHSRSESVDEQDSFVAKSVDGKGGRTSKQLPLCEGRLSEEGHFAESHPHTTPSAESRRPRHGYDSPPIIRLENKHINHELNAFVDALIFDVESLGCTNAKPGHPVSLTLSSPSRCAIVETSSGIADCGPPHMQRRGETSVTFVRYEMCSSSDVIPAFAKNTGSEGSVAKPRPYDNLVVLVHVHCSPLQNWHCTENIHPVSTLFSFHIYCIVFVCERVVV